MSALREFIWRLVILLFWTVVIIALVLATLT